MPPVQNDYVGETVDANYRSKQIATAFNGGSLPHSRAFVTSDFPHKNEWSRENLPEILFYLVPPHSDLGDVQLLVEGGQPVQSDRGTPIRYFEVLPRHISIDVEGWLIEAWRRLDPRIRMYDILDRMVADPAYAFGAGLVKPTVTSLQSRCYRGCRRHLKTWGRPVRSAEAHRTEVEALENLTSHNVTYNTALDVCSVRPDRLVKVKLVKTSWHGQLRLEKKEVTSDNWRDTTFPLDHFVNSRPGHQVVLNQVKPAAWELLLLLQERAGRHNLRHWSELPKACLPPSWFNSARNKPQPNDTFDGGCGVCTSMPNP